MQFMTKTIVLNSMSRQELAAWYKGLSYFSMCQIQSGFGYSSAEGLFNAMQAGETFSVKVDDQCNVWPTEVGVKEWQKS